MSGVSERTNGRANDPVLTSLFLLVPDHSEVVAAAAEAAAWVEEEELAKKEEELTDGNGRGKERRGSR